jgi:surface protein
MTIADQINRLNNAKAAIKQSIKNKGVAVSDTAKLDEYPALIDKIQTGSGGGGADPIYENIWNAMTANNTDYEGLFRDKYKMTELDLSNLDTSNVTNMVDMFSGCYNLTSIGDISNWNTGKVTNMQAMFYNSYLSSINVSGWDTGNVTTMNNMFAYCSQLYELDLSNFYTGSVTDMTRMFYSCGGLNYLYISSWDTGSATNMSYMFSDSGLYSLDLSGWYNTYNVQDMSYMFSGCGSLNELYLSNFDMSSVYNTDDMFANCYSLTYLHLDYCSYETVEKIITSSNFPEGNSGTIYCSEDVYNNLTPPGSWMFEIVY